MCPPNWSSKTHPSFPLQNLISFRPFSLIGVLFATRFLNSNTFFYKTISCLFIGLEKYSWQHVEQTTEDAGRTPERGGAAGWHLQCTDSRTQPCRDGREVLCAQRALLQPRQTTSSRATPQTTGDNAMITSINSCSFIAKRFGVISSSHQYNLMLPTYTNYTQ